MSSSDNEEQAKQNDLIIALLGRIAFPNGKLKQVVIRGGKKPGEMLKVYNYCDGNTPISNIAKKANVSQPAVSIAIDRWSEQGIILKRVKGNQVLPRKLFAID